IWDILEIIGISDKRQRRFAHDFRLNYTPVVALLVGWHAIGLPIRSFACGRIMQFPPDCMATWLLLLERKLGEAENSVCSSARCFSPLPARRKQKPSLLLVLPFSMSTTP